MCLNFVIWFKIYLQ